MQGKTKNFRHFTYPHKTIISDLQVKNPTYTHSNPYIHWLVLQKEIPKCIILQQINKKQSNPTFFFVILSFVQFLELSPVFSGSQDFSFDGFIIF